MQQLWRLGIDRNLLSRRLAAKGFASVKDGLEWLAIEEEIWFRCAGEVGQERQMLLICWLASHFAQDESSEVAIHFAPPAPTCSMERWMGKRDHLLASTIREISRSSKRGLRLRWIVATTWLGCGGQVDSAVRNAAHETRRGSQAGAAFVARGVGAMFPSPAVLSLREPVSLYAIGIAPCGL